MQAQAGNPGFLLAGAAVSGFEVDPNTSNNLATTFSTTSAAAGLPVDLQLTKTGPGTANGGVHADRQ